MLVVRYDLQAVKKFDLKILEEVFLINAYGIVISAITLIVEIIIHKLIRLS